jgi:glycosyltransferase involved in cell wall biosynthesis
MTPTISVCTTTWNAARFLPETLASVLAQTFTDFEVIIVDDGSTDRTPEVIAPYLADQRMRYYRYEHMGPGAARNLALRLARASLIAFLDADDLWLPHKLERQLELLRSDPGLGVVYTRRLLIDELGRELQYHQPPLYRGEVMAELFRNNFVCFSSALVRRAVFGKVGIFDEDLPLAVDYDFWLRVASAYRFDYVDEPLVKYRTGHSSLSSRAEERLVTVDHIMTRFLNLHGGRNILKPTVIRRARAETYYHLSLLRRQRSRLAALPLLVRSLLASPGYWPAWQGLFSLPLPEAVRRCLRRILGRPVDWSVRPLLNSSPTAVSL